MYNIFPLYIYIYMLIPRYISPSPPQRRLKPGKRSMIFCAWVLNRSHLVLLCFFTSENLKKKNDHCNHEFHNSGCILFFSIQGGPLPLVPSVTRIGPLWAIYRSYNPICNWIRGPPCSCCLIFVVMFQLRKGLVSNVCFEISSPQAGS